MMNTPRPELRLRYDTRSYFNVRAKADVSQLNLPYETKLTKLEKTKNKKKLNNKKPDMLRSNGKQSGESAESPKAPLNPPPNPIHNHNTDPDSTP